MAKHARTSSTGKTYGVPWWLDTGEEDCPHCEQAYSYVVEARCFECDAPICPMCIVRFGERIVCPDCRESANIE
jgi:hypothetical protein